MNRSKIIRQSTTRFVDVVAVVVCSLPTGTDLCLEDELARGNKVVRLTCAIFYFIFVFRSVKTLCLDDVVS